MLIKSRQSNSKHVKGVYWGVVVLRALYAGFYLVAKAAFSKGMNTYIFAFYRQAFATLLLVPFTLFFEWKKVPPLSFKVLCKMFFVSLLGITSSMDATGVALTYTSPSLTTAIGNSIPVIAFLISFLLRMESLQLKTGPGIAKLGGLVISLAGVLVLAFYKGPSVQFLSRHPLFGHDPLTQGTNSHRSSRMRWIAGCFLLLAANTLWSIWLILQGELVKSYPSRLIRTTIQVFFSALQAFVIAVTIERDVSEWELGWNIRLLAVTYSGFVVTGLNFCPQTWVIEKKGPVFLALSTPLGFIMTALCSTLLLGEMLILARADLIELIGGLYSVLWGKIKEQACSSAGEAEQGQELEHQTENPIGNV